MGGVTTTGADTITTSGSEVTAAPTCGEGGAGSLGYRATGTTIELFEVGPLSASSIDSGVQPPSATIVLTFTH